MIISYTKTCVKKKLLENGYHYLNKLKPNQLY